MKDNFKVTLQYEGTRYDGWQKQGNTDNTIQGKLEQVLEKMAGEPVEIQGSGRTDAGVHAMGQVANFHLKKGCEAAEIMTYLNRYLPDDIAVTAIERVPERFHSRFNAVKKTYIYQIEMGPKRDVFVRRMQYGLGQQLDVEAMRLAANQMVGTHDFKSFCGNSRMKKSTIRTVERITVHCDPGSSVVSLAFVGNGFLQNMVRIMVGTLIEVGQKKRRWKDIPAVLEAKDRQQAGFTAPAEGLCLAGVVYAAETSVQGNQL